MPGMTDRDHFAAAALTGLVAQGDDPVLSQQCEYAYRIADAMLRERAKTNHDAAPAARASVDSVAPQPTTRGDSDRTDKAAPRPSEGTGDTPEPVAWAVAGDYGEYAVALFSDKESAQTEADRRALVGFRPDYVVIPLYRQPTLTDAERDDICVWLAECMRQASTATEGCNEELAERWTGRAKRAAAMIERLGGEG